MENALVTIFLYTIVFYVLCGFNKSKQSTHAKNTVKVSSIKTQQRATTNAVPITSPISHVVSTQPVITPGTTVNTVIAHKPATGHIINSQALAGIFEDRDIPPVPTKNSRKQSKKKNISNFIKDIEASTLALTKT